MSMDTSKLEMSPIEYELNPGDGSIERPKGFKKRVKDSTQKVFARDGAKCKRCGSEQYLTLDHIVPSSLVVMFGLGKGETYADIDNLQVLCRRCNVFKGNRLDFTNPKTKEMLLKYLSLV